MMTVASRTSSRYDCPTSTGFSRIYDDPEMNYVAVVHLPLIVGITGPSKSGKTMVAKHLAADEGFYYTALSALLRERARRLGITAPSWEDLRDIALQWRRKEGNAVLVRRLFEDLINNGILRHQRAIVIDGILHPDEVRDLQYRPNFHLIAIDASQKLRFKVSKIWFTKDKRLSWRAFVERDRWERGVDTAAHGRPSAAPNIEECIQMTPLAQRFAFNGNESELLEQVSQFVRGLRAGT